MMREPMRSCLALRSAALFGMCAWQSGAALPPTALFAQSMQVPAARVIEEMRIVPNDSSRATLFLNVSSGSTVLRDGRILTTHSSEGVARVFSPAGRLLRVFGGPGDGPGEFRDPQGAGQRGDTIWVNDGARQRFVLYDSSFKWIGYIKKPAMSNTQVVLPGGMVMGFDVGGGFRGGAGRALFDSAGARVRGLNFLVPRAEMHTFPLRDRGAPGTVARDVLGVSPFTPIARSLMSRDGTNAIVIEPGGVFDARPGQFRFRRITPMNFEATAPVLVSLPPRRITSAERDSILDDAAPNDRVAADYKRNARVPEFYPAYYQATLMGDDLLWITEYGLPDSWTVIDMSGRVLMRIQFPPTFIPFAATRTNVWGTLKDKDDVHFIVRYRIVL